MLLTQLLGLFLNSDILILLGIVVESCLFISISTSCNCGLNNNSFVKHYKPEWKALAFSVK